jgi:TolA-binding protein
MRSPSQTELTGLFSALQQAKRGEEMPPVEAMTKRPPRGEAAGPPPAAATLAPEPTPAKHSRRDATEGPLLAKAEAAVERSATPVAPPLLVQPPPAPSSVTQLREPDEYAQALTLAKHGEHAEAAVILEQALAAKEGPRDLELYELALLKQRHLGDPKGALESLQAYRTEFPAGALRQEVDLSVMQTEAALGQSETVLIESARFLAEHPQSERADDVHLLRGDLLRKMGGYEQAAAEYRAVALAGGPALDDALYYWAYCRRQLGDGASAARALRDYLNRFPAGRHVDAAREALGR